MANGYNLPTTTTLESPVHGGLRGPTSAAATCFPEKEKEKVKKQKNKPNGSTPVNRGQAWAASWSQRGRRPRRLTGGGGTRAVSSSRSVQ